MSQMRRNRGIFATIAVSTFLGVASAAQAASADDIDRIRRAVDHLVGSQLPSGLFAYDFNFLANKGEDMATLTLAMAAREAGAAYGLGEYYLQFGDARMQAPIAAMLARLDAMSIPIGKSGLQAAVEWTGLPGLPFGRSRLRRTLDRAGLLYQRVGDGRLVSADGGYRTAWAGTTALALLAELHYFRASGDDRFAEQRRGWLAGLKALYLPRHGFRETAVTLDESSFANGEAWLAIASHHDTFPDDADTADLLLALDNYFLNDYDEATSNGFHHWGAIATQLRFAATGDPRFADFIRRTTRRVLDRPLQTAERRANTCARMEGLISAAATLIANGEGDSDLVRRLRGRIAAEMDKNRALQIRAGQTRLDFGGGVFLESPKLPDYAGAFLAGLDDLYVRTDTSQHCISALTKLQRFAIGDGG